MSHQRNVMLGSLLYTAVASHWTYYGTQLLFRADGQQITTHLHGISSTKRTAVQIAPPLHPACEPLDVASQISSRLQPALLPVALNTQ
jgi:hypothetical protein